MRRGHGRCAIDTRHSYARAYASDGRDGRDGRAAVTRWRDFRRVRAHATAFTYAHGASWS